MRDSKTIAAEIKAINATGRKTNRQQNEGRDGYDHTADTTSLEKEYNAAIIREFSAEWTQAVTSARRAAWNEMIRTNPPKSYKEQCDRENKIGFTLVNLKKAISLNK